MDFADFADKWLFPGSSYIYVNGDGRSPGDRASIRSGRFVIPSGAFLEFDGQISDPNTGQLSIYRNDHSNPQNIVWQTLGNRNIGQGWRKIHVALPVTGVPMSVSLFAIVQYPNLIGHISVNQRSRLGLCRTCDNSIFTLL